MGGGSSSGGSDFDFFGVFSLENILEVALRMAWGGSIVDELRNDGDRKLLTSRFSRLSTSPQRH